ncbi:MAG: Methionine-tRNA ligase [Candidatus Giovannonibacteria bacterium GW2011_GWA2_44_13b]|uniref:Methionine--tRNA ligase n=2 Tax=Candidatus Giovannoniibacteriota TaxID=1752738 RepID=A0A0G1H432_9BACT|nr:MAG: Methionine-tRNA ligase [Candidatus Giovannonibacteria bacterium GW2011_GWA2_44_13b]OGF81619.1 MAG: methionine--tRNA ligase subunit beta [Candidatus Giovannonibacteria bacterium RIFCSPLOWO2_01_FULL_44_16]
METISYDEFKKVELRVAKVLTAERIEGSDKLLKLEVDLGSSPSTSLGRETRQIIGGIGKMYAPEELIGKEIVIVANLEPRKLMGLESQGMLLAADDEGRPMLLMPYADVPQGSMIK